MQTAAAHGQAGLSLDCRHSKIAGAGEVTIGNAYLGTLPNVQTLTTIDEFAVSDSDIASIWVQTDAPSIDAIHVFKATVLHHVARSRA